MLIVREPCFKALQDVLTDRRPVTFRYGSNRRTVVVEVDHAEALVLAHRRADDLGKRKIEKMVSTSDTEFSRCRDHAMGVTQERQRQPVDPAAARAALSDRFRVRQ